MSTARAADVTGNRDLPPMEVLFGITSTMAVIREKLVRIAKTDVPVLLQGESGTGKDLLAKFLHVRSDRSQNNWVKVTCPAIPHTLIESELFGYEKGAFTGANITKPGRVEMAQQGSLFLDEVGTLDMQVQAKLLQVLQDGTFMRVGGQEARTVDTRLICAANGNLQQQVDEGTFRRDFLFRINAVTIDLPPLRQRTADLPILIEYFFKLYSESFQLTPKPFSRETIRLMEQYDWPGNIRQLENVVRCYVLIGSEEALMADLVPTVTASAIPEIDLLNPVSLKEITKAATRNLEREIILKVLQANDYSRQKTAKWLNISYRSLLYKLQESQGRDKEDRRSQVRI